jgi:flagellar protein FlbD
MIKVTKLNHSALILNSDLIEHIEITPDTVITLTSGQKFMVLESAQEIVEEVIAFRKSLFSSRCDSEPLKGESSSHGR